MLFAFPTSQAFRGITWIHAQCRTHHIRFHSLIPTVRISHIVSGKTTRDIYARRTRHTVTASCTGYFYITINFSFDLLNDFPVTLRHTANFCLPGNPHILFHLGSVVHAGKHHSHFRLIPQPAQPPFRGAPSRFLILQYPCRTLGQPLHQTPSSERLHDNYRQPLLMRIL